MPFFQLVHMLLSFSMMIRLGIIYTSVICDLLKIRDEMVGGGILVIIDIHLLIIWMRVNSLMGS